MDVVGEQLTGSRGGLRLADDGNAETGGGEGIGSVTRGPCMEHAVDGYLTDLTVPPRGTRCPTVPS
ncbi:hypothetical protein ACF08M_09925 [Streptomyces sp. NPDC015032]|uniref:hypothetical protein n=1 Tax=Streptomyces sp. NPDC015032 TaxID=3364937 RepID=UPI0036FF3844